MSDTDSRELVGLLQGIEQRCRSHAAGLPQQQEAPESWEGVVFSVLGTRLAVSLSEVVEMLPLPPVITKVPGARPWVRGIANNRGNLLPLIDLQAFLGGDLIVPDRRTRVLIVNHGEIVAGLLVENVMGMRHFLLEKQCECPEMVAPLAKYVRAAFQHEGETWPVFSAFTLAESPEFQFAAG
jgi:twitching motility protein PilI